jgi:ubiquinone/menaquinone biosynthesis C-methylase UbiE
MDAFSPRVVRAAYGAVAQPYAEAFGDDLHRLPVDLAALDLLVTRVGPRSRVLDVGCGPGQVGRYLTQQGVEVIGADLAVEMARLAESRSGLRAVCGDMRALPFASRSFSGAVAYYSVQHVRRQELGEALIELRRVLDPHGPLLVATHLGKGEVFVDEFLGHQIETVGGTLYGAEELSRMVERHMYSIEEMLFRDPLPHEHQSRRIYLLARTQ